MSDTDQKSGTQNQGSTSEHPSNTDQCPPSHSGRGQIDQAPGVTEPGEFPDANQSQPGRSDAIAPGSIGSDPAGIADPSGIGNPGPMHVDSPEELKEKYGEQAETGQDALDGVEVLPGPDDASDQGGTDVGPTDLQGDQDATDWGGVHPQQATTKREPSGSRRSS